MLHESTFFETGSAGVTARQGTARKNVLIEPPDLGHSRTHSSVRECAPVAEDRRQLLK
jgi:hypothetical protein